MPNNVIREQQLQAVTDAVKDYIDQKLATAADEQINIMLDNIFGIANSEVPS